MDVAEPKPLLTSQSRLWLIENGAHPANVPVYQGRARATGLNISAGALTPIRAPSSSRYGEFVTVGLQRAAPDLPTVTFESRMAADSISEMMRLINRRCEFDAQVHFGDCEDPQDFSQGFTIARIFEDVSPASLTAGDLGAFDEGAEAPITESLDVAAQRIYDVKRLRAAEIAASDITDPVVDIVICDSITCGACGRTSDGCQIVFILQGGTTGSPGLPAELLYSEDGGSTWGTSVITSLGLAEVPSKMACVGTNLVIVSNDSGSLHYADIADILDGVATWTEVSTGFDGSGAPNAIASVARDRTWIAGDGGRVYLSSDITGGVTEQADGSQTSQNLTAIRVLDRNNAVAVGASNAILVTSNGGSVWSLVVGPAVGVALTSIEMLSTQDWLVGTAGGEMYYTRNAGVSWTIKGFPGSGAGVVRDIKFASKNVGYLAHDTAAPVGRVLRTIDGGYSWNVLPEEAGLSIPDNDRITALAPCVDDVNVVFGGGIAANATDGFAIKFS